MGLCRGGASRASCVAQTADEVSTEATRREARTLLHLAPSTQEAGEAGRRSDPRGRHFIAIPLLATVKQRGCISPGS